MINKKVKNLENMEYCNDNKLTHLDNLPINLTTLICWGNRLTHLDNLPIDLKTLNCSGNYLTHSIFSKFFTFLFIIF